MLVLGWTLVWGGLLVFGYVAWQLWVTDWLNAGVQESAAADLSTSLASADPERETVDLDDLIPDPSDDLPATVEYFAEEAVDVGEPFAFLSIPAIDVEGLVVYEGVDRDTLRNGPGHMGRTPLPGQPGNAVISGHRTTYGRPFFDFDRLQPGDRVEVETEVGTHVYEIREILVVDPGDVWVAGARDGGWLTMTTCEPKFSARQRLVVVAEMVAGPNHPYVELVKLRDA